MGLVCHKFTVAALLFTKKRRLLDDSLNPIPTGNGLNQPLYSYHLTQAGRNRTKHAKGLLMTLKWPWEQWLSNDSLIAHWWPSDYSRRCLSVLCGLLACLLFCMSKYWGLCRNHSVTQLGKIFLFKFEDQTPWFKVLLLWYVLPMQSLTLLLLRSQ